MSWEAVKCWFRLPKYDIIWAQGPDLDYNRNMVWRQALELNRGHFLSIDSDIVFKPEDVQKIIEHLDNGLDAVTGVYPVGQPPYPPCVFERIPGDYKLCPAPDKLGEIGACGGGFLGINKNIMDKLPKDPFDNIREGDIFHGEDISFCHRLREKGFKLWCDPAIKLGHIRTQTIYGY